MNRKLSSKAPPSFYHKKTLKYTKRYLNIITISDTIFIKVHKVHKVHKNKHRYSETTTATLAKAEKATQVLTPWRQYME